MQRSFELTREELDDIDSFPKYKIIDREKHYRHNAEHRTFVFEKDGAMWQGVRTVWEDCGPGYEPVTVYEVEEYIEPVVRYRDKITPDAESVV